MITDIKKIIQHFKMLGEKQSAVAKRLGIAAGTLTSVLNIKHYIKISMRPAKIKILTKNVNRLIKELK